MLVARMAYAEGNLPPESRETLQKFWETVTGVSSEVMDREPVVVD